MFSFFEDVNMKIVFVSNFLNHHQIPFCEELIKNVDEFYFVATNNGDNQGYQKSEARDYLIDYNVDKYRAEKEIMTADAVIFGACPDNLVTLRMKENKLSFVYSERIFKKGILRCLIPRNFKMLRQRYLNHKNKNLYVLAASAFLPYDLSRIGFPIEKIFKWGYFPEYNLCDEKKQPNTILYAGRLLKLKHVETVIETAKRLKKDNIDFKVKIIGEGPELEHLICLKEKYKLNDYVEFEGSKTHEEVLEIMQKSSIYMFTSDFNEGWGAVLNESMASGCAVVASSAIGSVPFLIKHNENGMVYKFGNHKNAYRAVKELLVDNEKATSLGVKARETIASYDYKTAVERFLGGVNEFYENEKITPSDSGVFSPVEIVKNNWFK